MRIGLDVFVVIFQDGSKEFVFGMRYGLDDESIVSREVEE